MISNHAEGRMLLDQSRNATVKLARNTVLRQEGEDLIVKFWETDIIRIDPTDTYTLDSGGYRTVTTKDRFNNILPFGIYQDNGLWYVAHAGNRVMFNDGMKVRMLDGQMLALDAINAGEIEKAKKKVDRMTTRYINAFAAHVMRNGLEEPSSGDCWACHMTAEGNTEPMGFGHYLLHFRENYFVPSLFTKAFMELGFNDPGLVWHMMLCDIKSGREPFQLKHTLRRYFRTRKLGIVKALIAEG